MTLTRLAAVTLSALALSACATTPTAGTTSIPMGDYVLVGIGGKVIDIRTTTLNLAPGKISGQAPCNRYNAAQTASLPNFTIGEIAATRMACPSMAVEAEYFEALRNSNKLSYLDGVLTISGGPKSLTFERGEVSQ